MSSSPTISAVHFLQFQLSTGNHSPKQLKENSINKQCISLKLCTILSRVVKSLSDSLCPAWDMNHPLVQRIPTLYTT